MTQRRAMLILHGKQALNEDVRDAVADKRKQGWELDVRLTWEAAMPSAWSTKPWPPVIGTLSQVVATAPCAISPELWHWPKPRPA